ncbi:hypothetical protein A2422_00275 [Candidatus Woesebacteria bacterium RIFOXYC1_FULL_31_51]|uniref:Replication-associated protein ORF2/G2P domain-containing protein n=1 Tax=Candidatus Woesebacteria bacterium GW2011_GWC2_31_9 TaxID=1618586 RepID=A0A0F9YZ51_9BACT|nr:MAG: hypothetical protein UR17_C0001G0427 [Candidatus Woesebacteria bacterium GW2011_GWF1_31_35]KKP23085.1 MAG: hypothetical protein UR11_C0001G0059 [Candidatus Woesebacteria bacterium GW2011_GWC1_30_29]KKP26773.1 MAG: hypothetical protein UR13_C0002G0008 [Candidatus Woesebacteria bacterium GW2011_GWD1_31_12]KKP27348.1 MAG: hypothetical protein UR16_C0003G0008 [Candidatus Woesebacteria bacterium GW2011_GWB1_31_29]KKP31626.1 MAG: hypothetical protein UR21_C0007G0043 [Candidatus Woesebacteria 
MKSPMGEKMPEFVKSGSATPRDSEVLCLTNIRTIQQDGSNKPRKNNYGKPARIFSSPPHFCKKHHVVLLKKDRSNTFYSAQSFGISCNMWSCPVCRMSKTKKLRWLLIQVIKLNNLNHTFTITLDPSKIPSKYLTKYNSSGHYLSFLFNRFMTYLRRLMKRPIKYVWVKEFQQKTGNAHLHLMFNMYLPINPIRNYWSKIGGGVQMEIEQVRSIEGSAVYFSKYVTDMANSIENFTVGEKHYSISRSCIKPVKKYIPKIDIDDLFRQLPIDIFFLVYNLLLNPSTDEEIILAPHQEELDI